MDIDLILVPYDSARRGERMGAGPDALVAAGLPVRLERLGHRVRSTVVEPPSASWRAEIRTAFELSSAVSLAVRAARTAGRHPLVLTGNCNVALGVCAGLGEHVRVVWADAHADFNTPETTVSGFLDGMALAMLTGRCWTLAAQTIPDFVAIPEHRVWLIGARDFDPLEIQALDHSAIHRAPPAAVDLHWARTLAAQLDPRDPWYLHLDLDVLDASVGRANAYASPGGVSVEALTGMLRTLRAHALPAAVTISAYDPATDVTGGVSRAALAIIEAIFRE